MKRLCRPERGSRSARPTIHRSPRPFAPALVTFLLLASVRVWAADAGTSQAEIGPGADAGNPVTSAPNACTMPGGTGTPCSTDSDCAANPYATKCVTLQPNSAASRQCEIPCSAGGTAGGPDYGACSLGETCTQSPGDGSDYCLATRFRMTLSLLDECVNDFINGIQPSLGSTNNCSLEAQLASMLDQNGDGLFNIFDVGLCIQAFLNEPSCLGPNDCPGASDLIYCSSNADCGAGLYCDTTTNSCTRDCGVVASREVNFPNLTLPCSIPGTVCDADIGQCVPVNLANTTCQVNADCPAESYCFLGQCAPLCYQSIACPDSTWYCTEGNQCAPLPSPGASSASFVFVPQNYSVVFAQPTVTLNDVQQTTTSPLLIMDLISKQEVNTNPSINFGYRLVITYAVKQSAECETNQATWTAQTIADCVLTPSQQFVMPLDPFGTVQDVNSPGITVALNTAAAGNLTPGLYLATVTAVFDNGDTSSFQVAYKKSTPSGSYSGTFQTYLGAPANTLSPTFPFPLNMNLQVTSQAETWDQLLTNEHLHGASSTFIDTTSGFIVNGVIHGANSMAFANTADPGGVDDIQLRGIYSPALGTMHLIFEIDLPASFCINAQGDCSTQANTTNLAARNVFGRPIRRIIQLIGTYDPTSQHFSGTYREEIAGLLPVGGLPDAGADGGTDSVNLTLDGVFVTTQQTQDDSPVGIAAPLLAPNAPVVTYPDLSNVIAANEAVVSSSCYGNAAPDAGVGADAGVDPYATALADFATAGTFQSYVAHATPATIIFPDAVSFQAQIATALQQLSTSTNNGALTIYDYLSGQITLCQDANLGGQGVTVAPGGPENIATPACVDENMLLCGQALERRALLNGWAGPFSGQDPGQHQLFCADQEPSADCDYPQTPANPYLFTLQEHNRFYEQLQEARKFQSDHDLSDAFFAIYINQQNPFTQDTVLSFKQTNLESSLGLYNELLGNITDPVATELLYTWPISSFQGGSLQWMKELEVLMNDRLQAVQQLADLQRRLLTESGVVFTPLSQQFSQIEYLENVYLLALQEQWNGPGFQYDGAGTGLLSAARTAVQVLDDAKNPLGVTNNEVFFENTDLTIDNWQNYLQELIGADGQSGLVGQVQTDNASAITNLQASLSDVDALEQNLQSVEQNFQQTIYDLCGAPGDPVNLCATLVNQVEGLQADGGTQTSPLQLDGGTYKCQSVAGVDLPTDCSAVTAVLQTTFADAGVLCPLNQANNTLTVNGQSVPCVGGQMGDLLLQQASVLTTIQQLNVQVGNALQRVQIVQNNIKSVLTLDTTFNQANYALQSTAADLQTAQAEIDSVVDQLFTLDGVPDCLIVFGLADGTDCPGKAISAELIEIGTVIKATADLEFSTEVTALNNADLALSQSQDVSLTKVQAQADIENLIADLSDLSTEFMNQREALLGVQAQIYQTQLSVQQAASFETTNLTLLINQLIGRESGQVLVGNFLVQRAATTFEQALNVAYRTVVAFGYRYNLPAATQAQLIKQVYTAVTADDLMALATQLQTMAQNYCGNEGIDCDSYNNLAVLRVSLREKLFPNLVDEVDPTTGILVTKEQQFSNLITQPPYLHHRVVGTSTVDRIELPFSLSLQLVGNPPDQRWTLNPLECNQTLDWEPQAQGAGTDTVGDLAANMQVAYPNPPDGGSQLMVDPSLSITYEMNRDDTDWLRACHPVSVQTEVGTQPTLQYPINTYKVGYAPQSTNGSLDSPPTFYTRSTNLNACIDYPETAGNIPTANCWQLYGRDRSVAAPDWLIDIPLYVDGADTGNAWLAGAGLPADQRPILQDIILYFRYRTRPISDQ